MNEKIDFVIPWVDGSDPEWEKEKNKYLERENGFVDGSAKRYREFGLLRYLFRSIDKFAPWVNKVYFITNGQKPEWLNTEFEKLVWVKHEDFMDKESLPTFSVNPIELQLHRIEGLSDKFVYFNDDMCLIQPMYPFNFFKNGLPVMNPMVSLTVPRNVVDQFAHLMLNNIMIINSHFSARSVIGKNALSWLSPFRVGFKSAAYNTLPIVFKHFTGIAHTHMPSPLLKDVIEEVWEAEGDRLNKTLKNRFRSSDDVTHYLFCDWQLATGRFYAVKRKKTGKYFCIKGNPRENIDLVDAIKNRQYPVICMNDGIDDISDSEYEEVKNQVLGALESILPEKCSFEL